MHIIVDGYNVIRQTPHLLRRERRGLEEGRRALLEWLASGAPARRHRVTVVFDGWQGGKTEEADGWEEGIHVVYSRRGEKADDVIKRMAGRGGEEILVVTSDRDIATFVRRRGSAVISSASFEILLARENRGEAGRGNAAAEADGQTEAGPYAGREEEDADGRPAAKTKGPSRRPSRKEKTVRRALGKL